MTGVRLVLFEHEVLALKPARGGLRVPHGRGEGVITNEMLDVLDAESPVEVRRGGRIKAPGLVGITQHGRVTVELLPKLDREENRRSVDDARRNLLELLSYSGSLPEIVDEGAAQQMSRMPLLEAIIGLYAQTLLRALVEGLHATYVPVRENLSLIRGRIDFPEHLRRNLTAPHKAVCRYHRFTTDSPLNRIFRYTTWVTRRLSRHPENRRRLDALTAHLGDVTLASATVADCDRILLDRLSSRFGPALSWARVLLSGFQPDLRAGAQPAFDLLFDMSKVFEEWVARLCKQHLGAEYHKVQDQARIGHLLHLDTGRVKVAQIPDLLLEPFDGTPVILDTKYKCHPGSCDADNNDLRQVYLYQALLRASHPDSSPRVAVLLYPKRGAEPAERCDEAWLVDEATRQDRVRLRVATIDIDGAGRVHRARVARRIAQLCERPGM